MKYRFISADYLRNNLNKYIIVDVREKKAYDNYHIKGSINIEFEKFMKIKDYSQYLTEDNPIVIYCETGGRSLYVAAKLNASGYDAYSLSGGLKMYEKMKYISVKKNQSTLTDKNIDRI